MQTLKSSLIFFLFILVIPDLNYAQEDPYLGSIPFNDGPLEVKIGFNLMNITDVSEKNETIDFDAALYMNWIDPRLAYDADSAGMSDFVPGDHSHAPSLMYQGDFKVKEIFEGWRPHVVIPNGIGDRVVTHMGISIWPDGMVEYSETFYTKAETPMDLRVFPFDRQKLEIFFHPIRYQRDEILLIPDDRLARTWDQNMGIAEWSRKGVTMKEHPIEIAYFDDSKDVISEFIVTIEIQREPLHVLVSMILPLVILVSLTWCVFWMDEESASSRVNILFIGILSVVAYYFVILDTVPKISYLTLIDGFFIATFLILASSVVIALLVEKLNKAGKKEAGDRLDRICRWAFPVGYALFTLLLGAFFVNLN